MSRVVLVISLFMMLSLGVSAQQAGHVYSASEAMDGEGAEVLRLFPSASFKHADPFILVDDFSVSPPAGFPFHEHKGFEAITYMIAGGFVHRDNMGNTDTIMAGQAQRFTAGKGLVHSEMPGTTGINKGLQLWLNIPSETKQFLPSYQTVKILPIEATDDSTIIKRIVVGPGSPLNVTCGCNLSYIDVELKKNSIQFYPVQGYTSFIYVVQGGIQSGLAKITSGQFYFLESGKPHTVMSDADARFVYLSAKPLNQPIKQRGPYVY